jgi:hypothetical protein
MVNFGPSPSRHPTPIFEADINITVKKTGWEKGEVVNVTVLATWRGTTLLEVRKAAVSVGPGSNFLPLEWKGYGI